MRFHILARSRRAPYPFIVKLGHEVGRVAQEQMPRHVKVGDTGTFIHGMRPKWHIDAVTVRMK